MPTCASRELESTSENVLVVSSLTAGLELLAQASHAASVDQVFVIGGSQIYSEAMQLPGAFAILSSSCY
jgi:dihydrofolate reductase/thymidylate synthase